MNRRIHRILWFLGIAFVFHELEEWHIVSWQQTNFEPSQQFTDREARTLLILFALDNEVRPVAAVTIVITAETSP